MSKLIIKSSCAKMPASCWGKYKRIGVLEVEDDTKKVAMISKRAKGVIRVVRTWENLNVGKGVRDAYSRALSEANDLIDDMHQKEQG